MISGKHSRENEAQEDRDRGPAVWPQHFSVQTQSVFVHHFTILRLKINKHNNGLAWPPDNHCKRSMVVEVDGTTASPLVRLEHGGGRCKSCKD